MQTTEAIAVRSQDLPTLFRAADQGAIQSQRSYLWLVQIDLGLTILAALASSWTVTDAGVRLGLGIFYATCLLTGMALTFLLLYRKPEMNWLAMRAVAEQIKTMAWRYMMCCDPYPYESAQADADQQFRLDLMEILRNHEHVSTIIGARVTEVEHITPTMQNVRAGSLDVRKDIYRRERIKDQQAWFTSKAKANTRAYKRWLLAIGLTQLGGVIAVLVLARWPILDVSLGSILAALAAALIAWIQVKQHQKLAGSYSTAAIELGLVTVELPHVETEQKLSSLVEEAEGIMSRTWSKYRGTPP